MNFLIQSILEIATHVETIITAVSAIVGFVSGWFAKRKKDQRKKRGNYANI